MKIKIKLKAPKLDQQSPQIVASIDDLLIQILLLLPIKPLIKFKLVSKHWHSLITSPDFALRRTPHPNPPLGLYLPLENFEAPPKFNYIPFSIKNPTIPRFQKLKFAQDPSGIMIVQSCNGLLLCSSFMAYNGTRRYYVYNPTINRFSTLPKMERKLTVHGISLAFDPTTSPHYKVVCVRDSDAEFDSDENRLVQIEVYSSAMGPWRKCGEPFSAHVNFEHGVYWNNAMHWISNEQGGDSLYFNLNHDRTVHIMPMPPIPDGWDWRSNSYFGESGGHLHYIEVLGSTIQFNVYEMKTDYSEWFVKYVVDLSPVADAYPGMIRDYYNPGDWYYYAYSMLCVARGSKEEDDFLVLEIPGRVIRYNLAERSFESVHRFEGDEIKGLLLFPGTNGFQYIESLCCV